MTNFLTFLVMAMGFGFGSINSMEGLKNTSIVYLLLWVIEKYHEAYMIVTENIWFFVFTISAFVCWGALEINKHPEFIVEMFKA